MTSGRGRRSAVGMDRTSGAEKDQSESRDVDAGDRCDWRRGVLGSLGFIISREKTTPDLGEVVERLCACVAGR